MVRPNVVAAVAFSVTEPDAAPVVHADVDHELTVDEHPHVVVTREVEVSPP